MLLSAQGSGAGEAEAGRDHSGSCLYQALWDSQGLHPPEQDCVLQEVRGHSSSGTLPLTPVGTQTLQSYTPEVFGRS